MPKNLRFKGTRDLKQDFRELWPALHNSTHLHPGDHLPLSPFGEANLPGECGTPGKACSLNVLRFLEPVPELLPFPVFWDLS